MIHNLSVPTQSFPYTHELPENRTRLCNPCISFHTETENISKVTNRNTDHLGQGLGEIYLGQCPKQIETTWDFTVLLLFGGKTLLRLPRDSAQQGIMPLNPLREGPLGPLRLARPPQRQGLHWSLEWLSPGLRGDSDKLQKQSPRGARVQTSVRWQENGSSTYACPRESHPCLHCHQRIVFLNYFVYQV